MTSRPSTTCRLCDTSSAGMERFTECVKLDAGMDWRKHWIDVPALWGRRVCSSLGWIRGESSYRPRLRRPTGGRALVSSRSLLCSRGCRDRVEEGFVIHMIFCGYGEAYRVSNS